MDCFKLNKDHLLKKNFFFFLQFKDAWEKHRKHLPDTEAEDFVPQFTYNF